MASAKINFLVDNKLAKSHKTLLSDYKFVQKIEQDKNKLKV